jgi:hypothetical protein
MAKEIKINDFVKYEETRIPESSQTVIYELLDIKPDPDNKGQLLGSWHYLKVHDTVEVDKKFHNIGIVQSYNADGSYVLNTNVSFAPSERFRLTLRRGNPVDEEIYRFMEWCNENESNPNKRADVIPVFKKVNVVAFAKSEVEKKKALFEAQKIFFDMKDAEVKNVANLLGIPSDDDIEVVKNNLLLKVENATDLFLKTAKKSPETIDELVLVKAAIKDGILKVDKELKTVKFGDDNRLVLEYFGNKLKEEEVLKALQEKHPDVLEAVKVQLA